MGRTETKTLKLRKIELGNKRTVFVFENPDQPENPQKDFRYSAFDGAPQLVIGRYYDLTVDHVPTGKADGSEYHNIARKTRDGPYLIQESSAVMPAPTGEPQKSLGNYPTQSRDPKEKYWEDKATEDKVKNAEIRRMSNLNSALELGKIRAGAEGKAMTKEEIVELALYFEKFVIDGKKPE